MIQFDYHTFDPIGDFALASSGTKGASTCFTMSARCCIMLFTERDVSMQLPKYSTINTSIVITA